MNVFDHYQNFIILALEKIILDIQYKKIKHTPASIENILLHCIPNPRPDTVYFEYYLKDLIPKIFPQPNTSSKFEHNSNMHFQLFKLVNNEYYVLDETFHFPLNATTQQLQWLAEALQDPRFTIHLPEKLSLELKNLLKNNQIYSTYHHNWILRNQEKDSVTQNQAEKQHLSIIKTAIQDQQELEYTYRTRAGLEISGSCYPCHLEYSLRSDTYWLIVIAPNQDKDNALDILKWPLSGIISLKPLNQGNRQINELIAKHRGQKQAEKKEIKLKINLQHLDVCEDKSLTSAQKNTLERVFSLFATYERKVYLDPNNQTYSLNIFCYENDYFEVLKDIISLGKHITVLSPQDTRQEIIRRLKLSQSRYQNMGQQNSR